MAKSLPEDLSHEDYPYGFHFSREAWQRYDLSGLRQPAQREGAMAGQVYVIRSLADRMNRARDFGKPGVKPVRTGELLAMGLLTDILRYLVTWYCEEEQPGILAKGLAWIRERSGPAIEDLPLPAFVHRYTPQRVREAQYDEAAYLAGHTGNLSNREVAVRECILLYLNMLNPAMKPYHELYDDRPMRLETPYEELVQGIEAFFDHQPPLPELNMPLIRALRRHIDECPENIEAQLEYIRRYWRDLLPEALLERLSVTRGIIKEETTWRGLGPGEPQVLEFDEGIGGYPEIENFSIDRDWMPNLVLIAKTTYVWLDQLSKKYQRNIYRLDQVPEAELDQLARWGITGLWLIGLWERSVVSREIKQMMGNPEAVASAYSLYDYVIAEDLGGDAAYQDLRERAWKRGIRLASDMVPNHVGIYSRWVMEHPDWFIQLPYPPYPNYQYTGPDLSPDDRITVQIEDGYWTHADAAVVFLRRDNQTGDTRFIYHGNDGTSMPWNDTAQLNFLIPEVREAVVNTILHVARKFSVIRFDAAMTLAKKHYQRLWFPKSGDEGSVPSRSEHGMSQAQFDEVFPKEFWREVVDRVAQEAPDTLLLAEAFWLMEGYFVRTLGMHRVYNSAFMNMLKMEENAKYRQTLKNVLEYAPQILQRFVNFMNNPDELTAVEQFGKGDKYFGCAMLLVTLPGLPMLGHGQIEGYTEKYGMEYRRAYWDEQPDQHLIWRHEQEIFPLMRRRHLFSGAENFTFFDFVTPEGSVDENVFAYVNGTAHERALIVYNNAYQYTRGRVQLSTAINVGTAESQSFMHRSLVEALALDVADDVYYIFRDHRSGLEYLHHARDIAQYGLTLELQGYQYFALLDCTAIRDQDLSWATLHSTIGSRGVPSMEAAYQELVLAPILDPFRQALSGDLLNKILAPEPDTGAMARFEAYFTEFLEAVGDKIGRRPRATSILEDWRTEVERINRLREVLAELELDPEITAYLGNLAPLDASPAENTPAQTPAEAGPAVPSEAVARQAHRAGEIRLLRSRRIPILWSLLRRIGRVAKPETNGQEFDETAISANWMREWFLTKALTHAFQEMDGDHHRAMIDACIVKACVAHGRLPGTLPGAPWGQGLSRLFKDTAVQRALGMNHWGGRVYMNKELFEQLTGLLLLTFALTCLATQDAAGARDAIEQAYEDLQEILEATADAGYDVYHTLDALK